MRQVTHAIVPVLSAVALGLPSLQGSALGQVSSSTLLIPREALFAGPQVSAVQISPAGDAVAYLAPIAGVPNVWIQSLDEEGAEPRALSSFTDIAVTDIRWCLNGRQILCQASRAGLPVLRAVSIEDGSIVDLTGSGSGSSPGGGGGGGGGQARFIAADPDAPDEILIVSDRAQQLDVWRINTLTGQGDIVFENDMGFVSYIADGRLDPRVGLRFTDSGVLKVYLRGEGDEWQQLINWGPADTQASGPLGFSSDGRTLYLMDSREHNTAALFAYRMNEDGTTAYDLVASNDRADLRHVVMDPVTGHPQAVGHEYARLEWTILDEAIRPDWAMIRAAAEGDMTIASRSADDRRWVVAYERADGPTAYHLYDRDLGTTRLLLTDRVDLAALPLSTMTPQVITSRDGLDLVCYLTRPAGAASRRTPLVMLVHGGPWSRDSWGFNPLHQWLANRGYAVLSVNYRGSVGFGKDFARAGDRQWAAKMHEDIIDAANWAVDQGIADRRRIAIMGAGYGGYEALVGLAYTPDYFAAAVNIAGPSNVQTLLASIPPQLAPLRAMFLDRVGTPEERDYLMSISPLTHADAMARPLLIAESGNDSRVLEAETRHIVETMQAKKLPVTWVVFQDEGEGITRPSNHLALLAIAESFLAQHLGGRRQPIGAEIRQSSAQVRAGAGHVPGLSEALK